MKLFQIGENFDALDALLDETGREVTAEIQAWLDEYGELEADKLDRLAMFIRSKEHQALGFKAVADEFSTKRKRAESAVGWLKEYLEYYMKAQKITTIQGKLYRASIQKNGGLPPLVVHVAPALLPIECCRVQIEPDSEAIRAMLADPAKSGALEGKASLGEVGSHVRLR